VTRTLGTQHARERSLFGLGSWGPLKTWGVHNPDVGTLARGVLERVLLQQTDGQWLPPHRPAKNALMRTLRPFWLRLRPKIPSLTPIPLCEFPRLYEGQKRMMYERAVESLKVRALNRRDAYIKAFVKAEKLDLDSKPDPSPRVIQPRDIRFNASFGCYIRPLEHIVYGVLNRICGGRTIAKGTTVEDVGEMVHAKWRVFSRPCFVGIDQSRFSQCVSVEARHLCR